MAATPSRPPQTLWVALEWIEAHCVVPDGFRKGRPFELYRYQGQYLSQFYLVRGDAPWIPDNPLLASAFVYGRGLLVGPQKLGKNPLIAAQCCLEGDGPALLGGWAGRDDGYACSEHGCHCGWEYAYTAGEPMGMRWPQSLIQVTAFSEDSTENTYDALRPMIELGPLSDRIARTGEEFIRLPNGGRIDTVTSSNQSRLGQRITFVPQDELGLWTALNKMVKLADTQYRNLAGMQGRASLTTNAWDPSEQSVAKREFEASNVDVYRQFVQAPRSLSFTDKRERRKIYKIVYPDDVRRDTNPTRGHVDLDVIEAEAARMLEHDAAQAARFFGNVLVPGAGRAVDPDRWDELARPDRGKPPPGTRIGAGFDGSISDDATVLRGCTEDGFRFTIHKQIRPLGVAGRGWKINRTAVDQALRDMFATWDVGRLDCDPWKWRTEIEAWQAEYGEDRVLFFETNQDRRMGPAVDRWLTDIETGFATHDDDPEVNQHVKNAAKRKARAKDPDDDRRTLYTLVKPDDGGKIDGAVADVLAGEAAGTMPAPDTKPPVDRTMHLGGYR